MRLQWMIYALGDREAILDYIAIDSPQSAIAMDDRIEEQAERLISYPQTGRPGRIPGTRELVVNRTPYIIAYRLVADTVQLLRVLHGAQQWPDTMPDPNDYYASDSLLT